MSRTQKDNPRSRKERERAEVSRELNSKPERHIPRSKIRSQLRQLDIDELDELDALEFE